jgi:hypothetical protein
MKRLVILNVNRMAIDQRGLEIHQLAWLQGGINKLVVDRAYDAMRLRMLPVSPQSQET